MRRKELSIKHCVVLGVSLALALLSVPGFAESKGHAADAAAILDRHLEVSGGPDAHKAIKNRHMKARLTIPAHGIEGTLDVYIAKPNKMYTLLEASMIGKVESGSNGDVVWEVSGMTGPVIKEGKERTDMLRRGRLELASDWRDNYQKVETDGTEDIDGKICDWVVLTPQEGSSDKQCFDKETGLMVMTKMTLATPQGDMLLKTYLSDHREVDGLKLPFETKIVVMGQERHLKVESFEHNVELSADRFDLPEAIQSLVDQRSGSPAKSD